MRRIFVVLLLVSATLSTNSGSAQGQAVSNQVNIGPSPCTLFYDIAGIGCYRMLWQLGVPPAMAKAATIVSDTHVLVEETITNPDDYGESGSVAAEPTGASAVAPNSLPPICLPPDDLCVSSPSTLMPSEAVSSAGADAYEQILTGGNPSAPGVGGPNAYGMKWIHDQNCYTKRRGGITQGKGDLWGTGFYFKPLPGQAPSNPNYKYRAWGHQEAAEGREVSLGLDYGVAAIWHGVRPTHSDPVNALRDFEPLGYHDIPGGFSFNLGVAVGPISLSGSWAPTSGGRAGGSPEDQGSSHVAGWGASGSLSYDPTGAAGHSLWRVPKGQGASWKWGCFAAFLR